MNIKIRELNARLACLNHVEGFVHLKGNRDEIEKLATISSREEMPDFSLSDSERDGWNEEDDNRLSRFEARGFDWSMTSEMVDGLDD